MSSPKLLDSRAKKLKEPFGSLNPLVGYVNTYAALKDFSPI